jgi:hypothetical protein
VARLVDESRGHRDEIDETVTSGAANGRGRAVGKLEHPS